ncbi:MtrAB system histidine kinase MtrB [uncultured Amnibacterium sp.]|uniref:MtrAB system histidine kinase MtrB n=1 Tax=uncultured Amnibacterium sp. TaxID=1631851 RepID=UPI0035CBB1E4
MALRSELDRPFREPVTVERRPGQRVVVTPGLRLLQARRSIAAPFLAVVHFWRRSLQVRTVTGSVLLSAVALLAVGTYVSFTVSRAIFEDRVQQALVQSERATDVATKLFQASPAADSAAAGAVADNALQAAQTTAAASSGYALQAADGPGPVLLQTRASGDGISTSPSEELQRAVTRTPSGTHWQSVGIPVASGAVHPGIIVGSTLQIPGAGGQYELFLVYDFEDLQSTLDFVQRTLLLGGAALVLLIGAVTLLVVRLIVVPVRQAAAVSEQLAGGRLDRRIPERGEDVVATLARSFNHMADGLQRQITQLANLSRVQQRFVSDVSHELRTPLTTIRLASDVLYDRRDRFDAPTARSAELLRAQVQRFESLLADLLEISRMDAHAAELSVEPGSVVDVVREAVDALGNLAEQTGTEVRLETPGGHGEVQMDARRVARIVRNLLANAIEHGEGRPVVATIDSSATAVALGVRDHGVGMTGPQTLRVFDRFWRADPSRHRRIGGTGLGLAISLEDAQLHGGTLEVWSAPGQGAHFVLTLPRATAVPAGESPIALVPPDARAAGPAVRPARRRERVRS